MILEHKNMKGQADMYYKSYCNLPFSDVCCRRKKRFMYEFFDVDLSSVSFEWDEEKDRIKMKNMYRNYDITFLEK